MGVKWIIEELKGFGWTQSDIGNYLYLGQKTISDMYVGKIQMKDEYRISLINLVLSERKKRDAKV